MQVIKPLSGRVADSIIFATILYPRPETRNPINLHQGRSQYGVLHKNYLTEPDRAARLCRPYIARMFGEKPALERVF